MISFSTDKQKKKTVFDQWEIWFLFQLLKLRKIRVKLMNQIGDISDEFVNSGWEDHFQSDQYHYLHHR